ncbi:MAG: UvrD-helicase domain-containing protein [Candidatus Lightella neohaematopini]|nr:UvrD-helicase domain-containing protein [Candidatus Lightella neohaematopini]
MTINKINLLKTLNFYQQQAVTIKHNSVLILAGAGSGKTKVLVHRAAWLLNKCNPSNIIMVTFTNKAADELKNKVNNLLEKKYCFPWIGTFHSLAYKILRINYNEAKLPYNFQIIDNYDQIKLIKQVISNSNQSNILPNQVLQFINKKKDCGNRPNILSNNIMEYLYEQYQQLCNRNGLLDFNELLLRSYELLNDNLIILNKYHKQFTNILIDEFQDTSYIQYLWIRKLITDNNNIMVVGDDDQSIYSWRGAQSNNMQIFLHDYPHTSIIKLEENYRSTNNILQAANTLIQHNNTRLKKVLWTKNNHYKEEPIIIYYALDQFDEVKFIVKQIQLIKNSGISLSKCAILYRNNTQSRLLEDILIQNDIPYTIYGSVKFFNRREVKNVLAYLRLVHNHNDDISYIRIINTPKRGIGKRTINKIIELANTKKISFWQASNLIIKNNVLSVHHNHIINNFLSLIRKLYFDIYKQSIYLQLNTIIVNTGLLDMYIYEDKIKHLNSVDNIKELLNAAYQFELNYTEDKLFLLQSFLTYTNSSIDNNYESINLMTIHASKGLEFLHVFIIGMEEDNFPSKLSINMNQLEEERRLAYVGITRAISKLFMTHANTKFIYGKKIYCQPSRFIYEINNSILNIKRIYYYNNSNN